MSQPKRSRDAARQATPETGEAPDAPKQSGAGPTDALPFESALGKLEDIVTRLEAEALPLEESLKLFERGVELSRQCNATLDVAEHRIEILSRERTVSFDASLDNTLDMDMDRELDADEDRASEPDQADEEGLEG